ncbi:hypothetical protein M5D96_008448 [Drosophila gunungcola]|uniref:Uncharacterized protein n=1 Tax=Drosophila gunungcola TaxID=103775 RepID=A0A9Q0BNN9_9MUSC|nr:hypothetical protein M5D96_008448 [Drosophila gunungcola]
MAFLCGCCHNNHISSDPKWIKLPIPITNPKQEPFALTVESRGR